MSGTNVAQQLRLFWFAHDIDQINTVGDTNFLQHLPEVRSGCRMNQGAEAFATHGFNHTQGRQRINEAGGTLTRRHAVVHHQTLAGVKGAVL